MHVAVSEFARHVRRSRRSELDGDGSRDAVPGDRPAAQSGRRWRIRRDDEARRPAVELAEGTGARELYGEAVVHERHRHRYEVDNRFPPAARRGRARRLRHDVRGAAVEVVERRPPRGSSPASSTRSSSRGRCVRRRSSRVRRRGATERASRRARQAHSARAGSAAGDGLRRLGAGLREVATSRGGTRSVAASRRPRAPARRPCGRERTSRAATDFRSGEPPRSICIVAQPSPPVCCSDGIANWLYGTAVTYTSAPATSRPPHAVTRKHGETSAVERGIGFGDTWKRSTSRRAGGVSWPMLIGPLPPGQPVDRLRDDSRRGRG